MILNAPRVNQCCSQVSSRGYAVWVAHGTWTYYNDRSVMSFFSDEINELESKIIVCVVKRANYLHDLGEGIYMFSSRYHAISAVSVVTDMISVANVLINITTMKVSAFLDIEYFSICIYAYSL